MQQKQRQAQIHTEKVRLATYLYLFIVTCIGIIILTQKETMTETVFPVTKNKTVRNV